MMSHGFGAPVWRPDGLIVSGHLYDVATGRISQVIDPVPPEKCPRGRCSPQGPIVATMLVAVVMFFALPVTAIGQSQDWRELQFSTSEDVLECPA